MAYITEGESVSDKTVPAKQLVSEAASRGMHAAWIIPPNCGPRPVAIRGGLAGSIGRDFGCPNFDICAHAS